MTKFYDEIEALKQLVRRGLVLRFGDLDIRLESDAEHIFSCQMLALKIMADKKLKLNQEKLLKLILFHELGEIDAGDITPVDNINTSDKFKMEKEGVDRVSKVFNIPEMLLLWEEFEENKTPEAILAKVIDKLDTLMQVKRYSKRFNKPEVYEEFYNNAKDKIKGYEEYLLD